MTCPQCGNVLKSDANSCNVCGLDLAYIRENDPALYWRLKQAEQQQAVPPSFVPEPPPPPPMPMPRRKKGAAPWIALAVCIVLVVGIVIGITVANENLNSGPSTGPGTNSGNSNQSGGENMVSAANITRMDYTVDGKSASIQISYSEEGQPVFASITYDGASYNYFKLDWDIDGRLIGEYFYELNGSDRIGEYYQYTYDEAGNNTRIDYYDGQDKGYNVLVYDEAGVQNGMLMYNAEGTLIETQSYAYSGENRVSEYYVSNGGDYWVLYEHRYDEADYLYETILTDSDGYYERIAYTMLDDDTEQKYRYDVQGNILGYTAWEYDADGNIISQREYDQDYVEINVYEYAYDAAGRVTREYIAMNGNTQQKVYEYDPMGNLYSMVQDQTFADGTTSHTEYSYSFEAMQIPEALVENLKAGMEISEINMYFVNILG